jgi:hypothetical protein
VILGQARCLLLKVIKKQPTTFFSVFSVSSCSFPLSFLIHLLSCGLFAGKGQQNDSWSSKMTSCGAEDTRGGWDSKVKGSSCNDGGKWEKCW